jgi:hypothetical protein
MKQIRFPVEVLADFYEGNQINTAVELVNTINEILQERNLGTQPQLSYIYDPKKIIVENISED